jgi:hypothetical protein
MPPPNQARRTNRISAFGYAVIVFATFLGGAAGLFSFCTCFFAAGGDAKGPGGPLQISDTVVFLFLLATVLGGGELGRRFGIRLLVAQVDPANRCPSCGADRTVSRGRFCEECRRHSGEVGAGDAQ